MLLTEELAKGLDVISDNTKVRDDVFGKLVDVTVAILLQSQSPSDLGIRFSLESHLILLSIFIWL